MSVFTRLLVNKLAIAKTRTETTTQIARSAEQSRLRIEPVGLTANNISYAN
jgi:hypothetical protein